MSNKQELIKQSLELADKGAYHKDAINDVIRADFIRRRQYQNSEALMDLYKKLGRKYGKHYNTIMRICNG